MISFFRNRLVKWVLAPIAVLSAMGWAYIQYEYPTCTFRYKLTAEVMTPDGLKSGSSVVEVSYHTGARILPDPDPMTARLIGEATFIDLGSGKNLFVTLGTLDSGRKDDATDDLARRGRIQHEPSDYLVLKGALDPIWLPLKVFRLGRAYGKEREMCQRVSKFTNGAEQPVELNNLPTLVTFSDLLQPLTAKAVNPNELAKIFGAGYSLNVKAQITTENVTDSIATVLPWVKEDNRQGMDQYGHEINRLAWWEFYKFGQKAERSYILH